MRKNRTRTKLPPHHIAWLKAHPHRDEEWLRERLFDGFDVHHVDGDHKNNAANNLVLVEHTDHWFIHSGTWSLGRLKRRLDPPKPSPRAGYQLSLIGQRSYEMRVDGADWIEIERELGITYTRARNSAVLYADRNKLTRPPH